VLLEVGLLRMMSGQFAKPIERLGEKKSLPPLALKDHHLLELSNSKRIEVGNGE
jgi:hypothetical protein